MLTKFNEELFNNEIDNICKNIDELYRETLTFDKTIVITTEHLNHIAYVNKNEDVCYPMKRLYDELKNRLSYCFVQYDTENVEIFIIKKKDTISYHRN